LNGSEKLWKYRDSISIQYYSYVDLNISFSDSPQYQLIVEQTTTESETEKTFYVFYFIEIIKNVSGADTIKPKKDIAKLILSNDKGLYFRWIRNNIGSNAQGLPHGQFNRLLLSHIEIKLGENTKDFSLFEPAQYKQTDNNAPKLGQPFKLWKGKDNTKDFLNSSKDEGSFWLTLSDKVILEVKNGELRSKGADKPKKFEISNFTGDLPNVLAKPLKITFPEWKNDDQIPFHGTLSLVNASESQDNLQVKIELKIDRGDIESKFTQAKRERDNAEEEIKKRTGKKRGDIDQIISDTNDRFQKTSQEKQDDKWKKQLEEWSTLRDEFYTKKHTVETLKNLKEEIDQFEKGPFLPTPFSLYLKRYNKPEEKLLLFEIQPMDTKK
jgi:hypothetical protein